MKKFFYLCMLALVPVFTLTACGDDDEENGEVVYDKDGIKISESANQLVMVGSFEDDDFGMVNVRAVANFAGDVCTNATTSATYASEQLAKEAYDDLAEDYDEDELKNFSRNGATITEDLTAQLKGYSKKQVKEVFFKIAQKDPGYNEDDDEPIVQPQEGVIYAKGNVKIIETADQLVMTALYPIDDFGEDYGNITERIVADFKDGKCVKAISTMTFSSEEIAREYYEDLMNDLDSDDDPNMYSCNGNVVASNFTSDWAGLSKEQVKSYLLRIAYEYGNGNYEYVKPFSK